MPDRHERETLTTVDPKLTIQITDDGSRTLRTNEGGYTFHSCSGALTETRHVYFHNSGVEERISARLDTSVLEIGLGTSMAMLMTVDAAIANGTPLRYVAIEQAWLPAQIMNQLQCDSWVSDPDLVHRYMSWRERLEVKHGRELPFGPAIYGWDAGAQQRIQIHLADASDWNSDSEPFDAIYFDPFAPQDNPGLWSGPMLKKMHSMVRPGGTLVTYCVKREIRDRLSEVGFDVQKAPGPVGGKREVLVGRKP
ncbi:tRNA (5-methylaminomethyl-2-thiouridine)(34)-methyltransferase MnmD [Novipirellula artificiosorum]|nr:tRNA (5-methylaminomethyl-2-thiouridine)(34)-methyltransferase MnmD [Novipirellula artificiosorum]